MKKVRILILSAIMTLSIGVTAFASQTPDCNLKDNATNITTQSSTDPQPW